MGSEVTFGMVFSQMAALFLLLLLGYWMNRGKKLPHEAEGVLSQLAIKLFLPALQISVFAQWCTPENLQKYSNLILCGVVCFGGSMLIAILIARPLAGGKEYLTMVYRYALSFPNGSGFGLPIVLALFGSEALFQYQLFSLPSVVLGYSWGVAQLLPKEHRGGWRKQLGNLNNPAFMSAILGMILGLTGLGKYMPPLVETTLTNLGNCFSVVSLLLVGFVIGDYKIKELVGTGMGYLFSLFRLLVIPAFFLVIFKLVHAPIIMSVFAVLSVGCPCGMNAVLYPAAFGEDTKVGASMILISSTLAIATIPLLYAITC